MNMTNFTAKNPRTSYFVSRAENYFMLCSSNQAYTLTVYMTIEQNAKSIRTRRELNFIPVCRSRDNIEPILEPSMSLDTEMLNTKQDSKCSEKLKPLYLVSIETLGNVAQELVTQILNTSTTDLVINKVVVTSPKCPKPIFDSPSHIQMPFIWPDLQYTFTPQEMLRGTLDPSRNTLEKATYLVFGSAGQEKQRVSFPLAVTRKDVVLSKQTLKRVDELGNIFEHSFSQENVMMLFPTDSVEKESTDQLVIKEITMTSLILTPAIFLIDGAIKLQSYRFEKLTKFTHHERQKRKSNNLPDEVKPSDIIDKTHNMEETL